MPRKPIISGAAIIATGVAVGGANASTATGSATTPDEISPIAQAMQASPVPSDGGGDDGLFLFDEFELAEQHDGTWAGGVGGNRLSGGRTVTVTDPGSGKRKRFLIDDGTGEVFDADSGERVDPPAWARRQIKASADDSN